MSGHCPFGFFRFKRSSSWLDPERHGGVRAKTMPSVAFVAPSKCGVRDFLVLLRQQFVHKPHLIHPNRSIANVYDTRQSISRNFDGF